MQLLLRGDGRTGRSGDGEGEERDGWKKARGTERVLPGMLPGVKQLYFFLLRSKLDNKVLVFHPVVYKEYSYHETYSETLTTSTGC